MFYVVKRSTVAEIKKVTLESWSFCKILFNAIGFKALPLKGKISLKHSAVMIQVDQLILPYTFDFFGLAELQIMPKDAQA